MAKSKFFSVMLVDDNEIDNIINSKMIESANLSEVTFMHNTAISAIDFLKNIRKICTAEDNKLPKYIFLDIDMPMMDGFQFMEEFKNLDPFIKDYCNIIMLTASLNPKDQELAHSYPNLVKYVNKPLRSEVLQDL